MVPKRRAPDAKPAVAMGPRASGGAMFLTVEGGGIVYLWEVEVVQSKVDTGVSYWRELNVQLI